MDRPMAARERQDALDQLVALVIAQFAQRPELMEVFGLVGITTGTAKRALPRDLDGQHWVRAGKNPSPSAEHVFLCHEASVRHFLASSVRAHRCDATHG